MANLSSVDFSTGVLSSATTGTVMTINAVAAVAGTPAANAMTVQPSSLPFSVAVSSITGGTITTIGSVTSLTSGTVIVSSITGGTITTVGTVTSLTSGTVVISSGTLTTVGTVTTVGSISSGNIATIGSISSGTLASLSSGTVAIRNGANTAAVMASVTAPSSTDPALVVALSPNGLNPNGTAPSTGSAPTTAANDQVTIGVALDTSKLAVGSAGSSVSVAPTYLSFGSASSGNTTLVSSQASKKIRVLSMQLTATSTLDVQFVSGAPSSTVLSGVLHANGNGWGIVLPFSPIGHFQSVSSEGLVLNLSAASSVSGSLTYVLV